MKKRFLKKFFIVAALAAAWVALFTVNSALHRRAHNLLLAGNTGKAVSLLRGVVTFEPNFFIHRGSMGKKAMVAAFSETGEILGKRKHFVIDGKGPVLATAAGANGYLYAGIGGDTVIKMKLPGDAEPVWSYTTGGAVETRILPAPNGKVYVAAHDGLHMIDDATGRGRLLKPIRWAESSPAFASGAIYIGTDSGRLLKLDAETGKEIWGVSATGPVESSPEVSGELVFFGCNAGEIYAVDASDGTMMWGEGYGGRIEGRPLAMGGSVFFGNNDGILHSLDRDTGEILWRRDMGGGIVSSVVGEGKIIVTGTLKGDIFALSAKDGEEIWKYEGAGPMEADPTIHDGVVYVGTHHGRLLALDLETGKRLWGIITGWDIDESSPLVYDGYVIVGSMDRKVYAIGTGD